MLVNIGYAFMVAALAVSVFAMVAPHLGVVRNNWNLVASAQFATVLNLAFVLLASLVLWQAFLTDDFRVLFVWQNASSDMPVLYKFSAFWGGMNGSLLLWELVMAVFTTTVAYVYQRSHREILPYIITTMSVINTFLLLMLVTYANPLALQAGTPTEGRGLNPLLQHPAMAGHPPLLYLGYIGFSVPFAFAIASLVRGRLDNSWIIATRRWTLFAWYTLAMGQILGGQWAYEELGWGGYWGWDPVENAAFMPWLTGTAFLHSIMLQEKQNMMKVWNMVLIIITFSLSILGTFIVRSGVLNSVHAFAQSEIGPAFLSFVGLILAISFVLVFRRMKLLESRHTAERLLSKETTFLLNNLLLVGIAFTVFLGTVFPLLAEAIRGTKLSIQAPFFVTLTAPLGIALLALTGVCTMIAWRHTSLSFLLRHFRLPVAVAVATVAVLLALGMRQVPGLVLFTVCAFTMTVLLHDFARTVRARCSQLNIPLLQGMISTINRNQQRWGGALIHVGVVLLFIGFGGSFFNSESNVTLQPGQSAVVRDYKVLYQGPRQYQEGNATLHAANLDIFRGETLVANLLPARSFYPTQPDPLTEVAIHRTVAEDLYVVLASENADGTVTLRVRINPLVVWIWIAVPFITLGTGLAMLYRPRRLEATALSRSMGLVS
ncbi:MAG: heme lyase CcmF/NrfE family subunit [Candidatus Lambdaproteobacteria bacterium]|nr:heme lyase CcmF/NrfE family subunit [Candidatus Lambdaproteobacteria bacterium]